MNDDWLGQSDPELSAELSKVRNERKTAVTNAFSGIENAMNIGEGSTPLPKNIAKVVKKNTDVAIQNAKEVLADPDEAFEDKEFIRTTIKTQIIKMQSVLEIMEGSFMIGGEPRMFEVFSDLNRSVLDACSRLMALQKQVETSKMMKGGPELAQGDVLLSQTTTKTIKTKGGDMHNFLEQLRGESASS